MPVCPRESVLGAGRGGLCARVSCTAVVLKNSAWPQIKNCPGTAAQEPLSDQESLPRLTSQVTF